MKIGKELDASLLCVLVVPIDVTADNLQCILILKMEEFIESR